MKYKVLSAISLGVALLFPSCSDYLDMTPTDGASDKVIWSNVMNAELAINNFYHYISDLGTFGEQQSSAGMTEGFTDIFKYGSMTYNAYMYIPNELAYGGTVLTPNYVSTYLGGWSDRYKWLRYINQGLAYLDKYGSGISETDKLRLEAEMRFFRAMVYHDLIKRYKDVILYDKDLSQIAIDKALNSEKEGWDMVEADLMFAAKNLPVSKSANGRISSGAAWAFMTRSMLYAERWDAVKTAALEVEKMGYELTPQYKDAFTSNSVEAILQYSYDKAGMTQGFDNYYSPKGDAGNVLSGGYGTPTQEMVESFELVTGGFPDWTPWHNLSGTYETPPYDQLEPRFHATVLYNGSSWKGRSIEPYIGGKDGWAAWRTDPVPDGRTTTGYYLRKLVDEKHNFDEIQGGTQPWIAIRFAEVLLNYAEACYRTNDPINANAAVRRIRTRVALPYKDLTGDNLMKAIRQERKVELAYEGLYYWDMRRWGLAETAFTGLRVHGLKIENNGDGTFKYTYVDCDGQSRNFPKKMYRIPLPQDELQANSLVKQYPEWQ